MNFNEPWWAVVFLVGGAVFTFAAWHLIRIGIALYAFWLIGEDRRRAQQKRKDAP